MDEGMTTRTGWRGKVKMWKRKNRSDNAEVVLNLDRTTQKRLYSRGISVPRTTDRS